MLKRIVVILLLAVTMLAVVDTAGLPALRGACQDMGPYPCDD